MKNYILAVLASGIWINISEFIRNEMLIKELWISGFQEKGLAFPSSPLNGAIWGLWAFIFASILAWLCTKFDILSSTLIAWAMGFVLLWLAMWNMGVLPPKILYWAVPWSFLEVYVAALICRWIIAKRIAS